MPRAIAGGSGVRDRQVESVLILPALVAARDLSDTAELVDPDTLSNRVASGGNDGDDGRWRYELIAGCALALSGLADDEPLVGVVPAGGQLPAAPHGRAVAAGVGDLGDGGPCGRFYVLPRLGRDLVVERSAELAADVALERAAYFGVCLAFGAAAGDVG